MKKNIHEKINSSVSSDYIKKTLLNENNQKNHTFYLNLFDFILPAFDNIDEDVKDNLAFGGYLYFRFLLEFDSFLDSKAVDKLMIAQNLSNMVDLHELAIKQLSSIFNNDSIFWNKLYQRKCEYKSAIFKEKAFSKSKNDFTESIFLEFASGKSAVCYTAIDALMILVAIETKPKQILLEDCLKNIHTAFQYLDDIEDFKKDWEEGQWTYPHFFLSNYLKENLIVVDSFTVQYKYLFLSGIAQSLLKKAVFHYTKAFNISSKLGLNELKAYLLKQIDQVQVFENFILVT